jgi:cysteine desulfuration protein SufE
MPSLETIAEPFQMVDNDMRLELLLEYAEKLPPLPAEYHELRDAGLNMVHECQSPVFLQVEVEDGTVQLYADVPREAPTARAFVSIMREAFHGARPEEVAEAPPDVLRLLGLSGLLGMQRTRGLSAIYQRIKNEVTRKAKQNGVPEEQDSASDAPDDDRGHA